MQRWLVHGFVLGCVVALGLVVPRPALMATSSALTLGTSAAIQDPLVAGIVVAHARYPSVAQAVVAKPAPTPLLRLSWPVQGVLTQTFGPSSFYFEPSVLVGTYRMAHFHTGVDLAAPTGVPVGAAADGTVIKAGWGPGGYGDVIVLRHPGGFFTLYAHLSQVDVHVGEQVSGGAVIGAVGSTGNSTGSHLHFEVRPSERTVEDPMLALEPARQPSWTGPPVTV